MCGGLHLLALIYQRFADVRMESVLELLDLCHLLRANGLTFCWGSTNAVSRQEGF